MADPHAQATGRPPPSSLDATPCEECRTPIAPAEWRRVQWVCPACAFPNPMPARERLTLIADAGSLAFVAGSPAGGDPLGFVDLRPYPERLRSARQDTGEDESFISARATIGGVPAVV